MRIIKDVNTICDDKMMIVEVFKRYMLTANFQR